MGAEKDPSRPLAGGHNATAEADWRSTLARSGLVAKGVLYGSLGVLAIEVASGGAASHSASRRGAIELVASQPLGPWLLGTFTAGLFALGIWQVILAVTGDPVEGSEPSDRLKFAGKAIPYLATAVTALSTLLRQESTSDTGAGGRSSEDAVTATVMSWPAGPWLLGLVGSTIIAIAVFELYKHGWKKAFMTRIDRSMSHDVRKAVERAGQAGYAARAVIATIVGVFLIVAALQHDPQEVVRLSGALGALPEQAWGQALLWLVSVGLLLYGVFCIAEAKYRRAT